ELTPALMKSAAEAVDALHVGEVERHQRGFAFACAGVFGLDLVVQFLKPAHRAGHGNDMRAALCQFARKKIADAARCARHKSQTARQVDAHACPLNACKEISRYWPAAKACAHCFRHPDRRGGSDTRP